MQFLINELKSLAKRIRSFLFLDKKREEEIEIVVEFLDKKKLVKLV